MALSNRERVGKALDLLCAALAPPPNWSALLPRTAAP